MLSVTLLLLHTHFISSYLDPPNSVGVPPGCTKNVTVITNSPESCAFYYSDAFLHNETARARRSVQLMDSFPVTSTPYSQPNVERFQALFRKLMQPHPAVNTTVNVVVFGGSLTAGSHVGAQHAWPVRLEGMLRKRYPTHRVNVFNRAEGGTTAHWALTRLNTLFMDLGDTKGGDPVTNVDLAIIDYDVNDCAVYGDNKGPCGR